MNLIISVGGLTVESQIFLVSENKCLCVCDTLFVCVCVCDTLFVCVCVCAGDAMLSRHTGIDIRQLQLVGHMASTHSGEVRSSYKVKFSQKETNTG